MRKLVDGVFGEILVNYFQAELGITPIEAECLDSVSQLEGNYRITFDDETVIDYKVIFDSPYSLDIATVEEFNRVL